MFTSNRLEADMGGEFSVFSVKSLLPRFWSALLGPCLDERVIDLTAISTRRITTLSIVVKSASCMGFLKLMTALSTAFIILSSTFFPVTWFWHALISPSTIFSGSLWWPSVWGPRVWFPIAPTFSLLPITNSFKVSLNWLGCFVCWFLVLRAFLGKYLYWGSEYKSKCGISNYIN